MKRADEAVPADHPMPSGPVERHYTTHEAAILIAVSPGHLRNLRVANKGPSWVVTLDGQVRYPASALRVYLGETG